MTNAVRERPTIHLVACTKAKRAEPWPARDLYAASDWFAKARAYVEGEGGPWFILSARFGLVHPAQVLPPYEASLIGAPIAERRRWAADVARQLAHYPPAAGARFVFLAGRQYREFLVDRLGGPDRCGAPLAQLGLGEQKAWLAAHARRALSPRA